MKVVILDGSQTNNITGEQVGKVLVSEFRTHSCDLEHSIKVAR